MNKLTKLVIHNFRSISDIELDIDGLGLVHITGVNNDNELSPSNGAGKSTLKSALCWNLFGMTETGLKGDDILSWNNPSNCKVETIWVIHNETFKIIRYRKYTKKGNKIEIYQNDVDITPADNKKSQEFIINLLNFNYDMFCILLTTGMTSKKLNEFMLMSDTEKKQFTDFLLDLNFLSIAKEKVQEDYKTNNNILVKLEASMESQQSVLQSYLDKEIELNKFKDIYEEERGKKIETAKNSITAAQTLIDTWESNIKEMKKNKKDTSEIEEQILTYRNNIDILQKSIETNYNHITDMNNRINEIKDIIRDIQIKEASIQSEYNALQKEIENKKIELSNLSVPDKTTETPYNQKLEQVIAQKDVLVQKQNKLTNKTISTKICPTCGQQIDKDIYNKLKQELEQEKIDIQKQIEELDKRIEKGKQVINNYIEQKYKDDLDKYKQDKQNIKNEIDKLTKQLNKVSFTSTDISGYNEEIQKIETKIIKVKDRIKSKQGKIDTHKITISKLKGTLSAIKEIDLKIQEYKDLITEKQSYITSTNQSIINIQNEDNPYINLISSIQTDIKNTKNSIDKYKKDIDTHKLDNKYLSYLIQAFGNKGIKSLILDSVTDVLDKNVNYCLNFLTGGQLSVAFETQKQLKSGDIAEKFDASVFKDGYKVSYIDLSKGERIRVSFAVNYALKEVAKNYNNIQVNFNWLDEILDGLDDVGCYQVIQFLRRELSVYDSILVVSHNSNVTNLFDKNIIVEKTKGVTTLR